MTRGRSRIDTLPLTVVLVAIFVVDALGIVSPVLGQQLPWLPFTWFLIAASLPVVLALTIVSVRYRLISNQLEIRSGLSLSWRIQLVDIHCVVPVVSLRPAPALSSQRLRVDYQYQHGKQIRSLQISPHAAELFLQDWRRRMPDFICSTAASSVTAAPSCFSILSPPEVTRRCRG